MNLASLSMIAVLACAQAAEPPKAQPAVPKPGQNQAVAKPPDRYRVQIFALRSERERLIGMAEILVFTLDGKCIRRGETRPFGEPFDAEEVAPLDRAFGKLVVVARERPGSAVTGHLLLVFDSQNNNWRPATTYTWRPAQLEKSTRRDLESEKGAWIATEDYDVSAGQFRPMPAGKAFARVPIQVLVPTKPLPVTRWVPTAGACCACGEDGLGGSAPAGPPPDAPFPLAKQRLGSSQLEARGARAAAIVERGRPLALELPWADFGSGWVRGPYGMLWQAPLESPGL